MGQDIIELEDELQDEQDVIEQNDTNVSALIENKESMLLQTESVQKLGQQAAEIKIKEDFREQAVNLKKRKIDNDEQEFDNDLREMRLAHRKAEEIRMHKYRMAQLAKDSKHKAMLDKRVKLIEEYGYLYKRDEQGVPIDFSYSRTVNKLRTLSRNFEKLDKPFKTLLKIILFGGIIIGALVLLKHFNVIN